MAKHIAPTRRANHPLAAEPNGSKASHDRLRVKSNFLKHFKLILAVQSWAKKYSALYSPQISGFIAPSRLMKRGVRVVTNVGAGCGGRGSVEKTSDAAADGEIVWSWRSDAGAKSRSDSDATVATKHGHRGDHV
jgi:hypothetical protein